jgi:hypothetical protein
MAKRFNATSGGTASGFCTARRQPLPGSLQRTIPALRAVQILHRNDRRGKRRRCLVIWEQVPGPVVWHILFRRDRDRLPLRRQLCIVRGPRLLQNGAVLLCAVLHASVAGCTERAMSIERRSVICRRARSERLVGLKAHRVRRRMDRAVAVRRCCSATHGRSQSCSRSSRRSLGLWLLPARAAEMRFLNSQHRL